MTPCNLLEVLFCSQHSRFTMNDLKQISFDCCSIGSPKQHQKKKENTVPSFWLRAISHPFNYWAFLWLKHLTQPPFALVDKVKQLSSIPKSETNL